MDRYIHAWLPQPDQIECQNDNLPRQSPIYCGVKSHDSVLLC